MAVYNEPHLSLADQLSLLKHRGLQITNDVAAIVIDPQSSWTQELAALIRSFPNVPYVSIQDMGFPIDWQNHDFWK